MAPKTIGLTGGIGSGKSFIAEIFKILGIQVYNSDINAKLLMSENKQLKNGIIKLLGKKAYHSDGQLNRELIAEKIFKNKSKLEKINNLVHPAVREDFQNFVKKHKKHQYVINEAALFVENGSHKDFDHLITVVAPEEVRIERVMKRDGVNQEEVVERMQNQSSDESKMKVSDHVIFNDASENLFVQISSIHQALVK
ncbi:dephospho-CoA kinase [Portibacter marinus]|uniref:dephospho-CoA kinase n=1 Tax=Portibacter marinus TaxID=2898660 RepID=UPI001EEAB47C|nr:dephospho-CoA kinase [Portibacter marinus]